MLLEGMSGERLSTFRQVLARPLVVKTRTRDWWESLACTDLIFSLIFSGSHIGTDQEDHTEDPSDLLPHGHCDRVGHGHCDGGKLPLWWKIELHFLPKSNARLILIANGRYWHHSPQLHTRISGQRGPQGQGNSSAALMPFCPVVKSLCRIMNPFPVVLSLYRVR